MDKTVQIDGSLTLGEFRRITQDLPDNTDVYVFVGINKIPRAGAAFETLVGIEIVHSDEPPPSVHLLIEQTDIIGAVFRPQHPPKETEEDAG